MTENRNYIECAGFRIPSDWSVEELAQALERRKIRFRNEEEIISVFGNALRLKSSLEKDISRLRAEVTKLNGYVEERQKKATCPHCGTLWIELGVKDHAP